MTSQPEHADLTSALQESLDLGGDAEDLAKTAMEWWAPNDMGPNAGRLSGWNLEWNHTLGRWITKDVADHINNLRHAYELKVADLAAETQRNETAARQTAELEARLDSMSEHAAAETGRAQSYLNQDGPQTSALAGVADDGDDGRFVGGASMSLGDEVLDVAEVIRQAIHNSHDKTYRFPEDTEDHVASVARLIAEEGR